jgi:hypothetical protein
MRPQGGTAREYTVVLHTEAFFHWSFSHEQLSQPRKPEVSQIPRHSPPAVSSGPS